MGRPPLGVGTYGSLATARIDGGQWEAKARFRDHDGKTRPFRRLGRTKTIAEQRLKDFFRDRAASASELTATHRMSTLFDAYLVEVDEDTSKAHGTKRLYRIAVEAHLRPALGQLFVREVTVQAVNRCLRDVRDNSGPDIAKTARTVLSGVMNLAVRHGATSRNPVRDAISLPAVRKSATRALSRHETDEVVDLFRSNELAVAWDLPDLVEWMLYTGCRIGEALALRYGTNPNGEQLLDLTAGTWEVNATVVRQTGHGLIIQERTKSDAGWRVLALPPGAVAMLRRRADEVRLRPPSGVVFGSPSARALRDPSNTDADLRAILDPHNCDHCDGTGYQLAAVGGFLLNGKGRKVRCRLGPTAWVTSHTFRKTVATRMDEAGCTAREIADQLGHAKPSMTQDVYMGRNVVSARAAQVLDR